MHYTLQNAKSAWAGEGDQIQCNEFHPPYVCRCYCCSEDFCNQSQYRTSCLGMFLFIFLIPIGRFLLIPIFASNKEKASNFSKNLTSVA